MKGKTAKKLNKIVATILSVSLIIRIKLRTMRQTVMKAPTAF